MCVSVPVCEVERDCTCGSVAVHKDDCALVAFTSTNSLFQVLRTPGNSCTVERRHYRHKSAHIHTADT